MTMTMPAVLTFDLSRFGSVSASHDAADRMLRALEIERASVGDEAQVALDFTGVRLVTDSFVDGFVVAVAQDALDRGHPMPGMTGMSPEVERDVRDVLSLRGLTLLAALDEAASPVSRRKRGSAGRA